MMSVVWDEPEQSQRHSKNIMCVVASRKIIYDIVESWTEHRAEWNFVHDFCEINDPFSFFPTRGCKKNAFFVINALWHYARHSTVYAQLINNYYLFGCNFLAIMMRMVVIRWKSQRENFIQFSSSLVDSVRNSYRRYLNILSWYKSTKSNIKSDFQFFSLKKQLKAEFYFI